MTDSPQTAPPTKYRLELSTEVVPATQIKIDGIEYSLLTMDHLSAEDEAVVVASFTMYERLTNALEVASTDKEARNIAVKLRTKRIEIIERLTTIPKDVINGVPIQKQALLLNAIQEEIGSVNDDEEDEDKPDDGTFPVEFDREIDDSAVAGV